MLPKFDELVDLDVVEIDRLERFRHDFFRQLFSQVPGLAAVIGVVLNIDKRIDNPRGEILEAFRLFRLIRIAGSVFCDNICFAVIRCVRSIVSTGLRVPREGRP